MLSSKQKASLIIVCILLVVSLSIQALGVSLYFNVLNSFSNSESKNDTEPSDETETETTSDSSSKGSNDLGRAVGGVFAILLMFVFMFLALGIGGVLAIICGIVSLVTLKHAEGKARGPFIGASITSGVLLLPAIIFIVTAIINNMAQAA